MATEQLLPPTVTPVTPAGVYVALRSAWRAQMGGEPARASLLVLLAQWALETGRGRECRAYNVGNAKHVPGDGRDYCEFTTTEVVAGVTRTMVCAFRAFVSLDAGASDYLAMLRSNFAGAWPEVVAGDASAFVQRLAAEHYFTADPATYERTLCTLVTELDREVGADTVAELPAGVATSFVGPTGQPTPPRDLPPDANT